MYSFSSRVRYSECDQNGILTVPSLINYLQDCSTFHTESIGHGVGYCTNHGFAWFIAAWQIQVERMPRFCDQIKVSTWSFANRSTLANRNFIITDEAGKTMVQADSLWFPFNIAKGRAMRIPESEYVYLSDENPVNLPPTKRKLQISGEFTTLDPIVVTGQHIDSNHHVNNGQYVAMASHVIRSCDEALVPRRLLVQYRQAAKLGDVIVPHLYVEDGGYAVDLANEQGESFAIVRMER